MPVYRLLTGPDDASFCHRVSEALALGYELYGSPAATHDGRCIIVAQALLWLAAAITPRSLKSLRLAVYWDNARGACDRIP
jgi:hypothetical protein